jgi:glucokinase
MSSQARIAGLEIGGTKLQVGIASTDQPHVILDRRRWEIDRTGGAAGILIQIERGLSELSVDAPIMELGIGFGGPVNTGSGSVITSHQVTGWDDFPLVQWCRDKFNLPASLGNDCNVAALAEATLGAGRGLRRVLYVTVGTGIGGGMVIDGRIDGEFRPAVAEIGHLRPGLEATSPQATVESVASGLSIERMALRAIQDRSSPQATNDRISDLLGYCGGDASQLTTLAVATSARDGNPLAIELLQRAARVLGWALAQATTLLAPERIVIGGGVALSGSAYLDEVQRSFDTFLFPPLREACDLVPAALGEWPVVHGALLLASRSVTVRATTM